MISAVFRNVSSGQEQSWFSSSLSCFFQLTSDSSSYGQPVHNNLDQVLYNILKKYIFVPEENKRNVLSYKDALVNLAETNVPYKTKKRTLVQEVDGFIQDQERIKGTERASPIHTLFHR